ncbi:MAG: hypothetical protein L6R48_08265, partial [Planctomycetes bacterium]|nr:hypothetical protein [Planctomycetota bacterium]
MTRPSIAPALAARLLAAAPARLRRRLDQDPRLAADWTWADDGAVCTVTVDHDTRVALHGPVLADEAQIRCSCLLSPRCLHVLACLTMLAPAETEPAVTPAPAATDAGPVGADRCAAAEHALEAVGLLLATGATAAGTVVQAELLRALHGARTAGCHRLGAGLGRLLGGVRRLRDGVPGADAADTLADAGEACAAALGLLAPGATAADAGSARRAY